MLNELKTVLPKLTASDRKFAESLLEQSSRRMLSPKQNEWVGKLVARASAPAPIGTEIGASIMGVVELLDRAAEHLKYPKLLVRVGDQDLRISIAGERSSAPGSINVTSTAKGWTDRVFFGRVTRTGVYEPHRDVQPETATAITLALRALAADPAGVAAAYGKLTGNCCFCGDTLTDGRSTEVGYGPVCAKHYGLPWGSRKAKAA
jgi:hypothetical protein